MIYLLESCDFNYESPDSTTQSNMFRQTVVYTRYPITRSIATILHGSDLQQVVETFVSAVVASLPTSQTEMDTYCLAQEEDLFALKWWSIAVQDGWRSILYQQQWESTGKLGTHYLFTIIYCCLTAVLLFYFLYRRVFLTEYMNGIKESLNVRWWLNCLCGGLEFPPLWEKWSKNAKYVQGMQNLLENHSFHLLFQIIQCKR